MSKTWPMEHEKYTELEGYTNPTLDEIFELAKNLKVMKHLNDMWWFYYRGTVWERSAKYKKMPKRPRQDNKNFINRGSGMGNRNPIRYPKKCRKTAWKRFYKLFPKLKPEEE